jgi:hypothetical protein
VSRTCSSRHGVEFDHARPKVKLSPPGVGERIPSPGRTTSSPPESPSRDIHGLSGTRAWR